MTQSLAGTPSPFHDGEVALQKTVGVAERMEAFGRRVIRDFMPDQHRDFYRQLPFIVLGSVDPAGDTWVTLLSGRPGFMTSPDPKHLNFAAQPDPRDPATESLADGAAVGLLGIELHTRRRNRMNGTLQQQTPQGFAIAVEHAFGNCPQYIQLRDFTFVREPDDFAAVPAAQALDMDSRQVRAMISAADTFFVSSYVDDVAGRHVDASHRGGKPGFVRINDDGSLTIPDFVGNLHFNTFGNFMLNPKAGLVFPDFETGDMLHLTGDAELVLESDEIAAFQGAERLWVFRPRKVVLRPEALPLRFAMQAEGWSPNSLMTGDWEQAADRIAAEQLRNSWRPFRIARVVDESSVIRSFHLEPADGKGIVTHEAGQQAGGAVRVIRLLELTEGAAPGIDYDSEGRISADLFRQTLPFDAYDFYMCGPPPFMQGLYDQLSDVGVADARIHAEAFGPASLKRREPASVDALPQVSGKPVPVAFMKSGKEARWDAAAGTLLDLAEARGLTPEYSCRGGSCGTCAVKVLAGKVTYETRPSARVAPDQALVCCAVPADPSAGGGDRLILDL